MVTIGEYAITGLLSLLALAIVVLVVYGVVDSLKKSEAGVKDTMEWVIVILVFVAICVGVGAAVHESTDGIILERLRA